MSEENLIQIDIDLGAKSYPIFIGSNFLPNIAEMIKPYVRSDKLFVITDELVDALYLPYMMDALEDEYDVQVLALPPGEQTKTLEMADMVIERILKSGCDRLSTIVSVGGGVIGDLAGFCASVLLRGIDFIQIPTTLLAQTDSSVGGKTAVNTPVGKNLIGTFHQPKAVFIDVSTLKTLDPQHVLAGFAEVAKYGLILSEDFWTWLKENGKNVLALEETACMYAVEQACRLKAAIVSADEFEENGLRALLNYGHTVGHAVEAASGMNGSILHGEAVAIGGIVAAYLSATLGLCDERLPDQIKKTYEDWGLQTSIKISIKTQDLIARMQKDKKAIDGHLNFVLLEQIGQGVLVNDVSTEIVSEILNTKGRKYAFATF